MRGGDTLCGGHGCGDKLLFPLRANHKEDEFYSLGDELTALLSIDQRNGGRQSYVWYHVQLSALSNKTLRGLDSYIT